MLELVIKHVKKYKGTLVALVLLSVFATSASIFVPYYSGLFIDILITTSSVDEVINYALIIIVIGLCGALASYASNMMTVKLTTRTSFNMISETITHIQKIPYNEYTSRFNPAYLVQRINTDVNSLVSIFVSNFVTVFLNGATFLIIIYLISQINMTIFFLALAFLPIYLVCYMLLRGPLFKRSREMKERQNHFSKVLFEQLNRIQEIKAEASFSKSESNSEKSFHDYFKSLISFNKVSYVFVSLDSIVSICFQSATLIVGGIQIINGDMTIGQFTIVNAYFFMLIAVVKYFFNLGKAYQDSRSSYDRMVELLDIKNENNGSIPLKDISTIEVKDVTYSDSEPALIKEMSIKFETGKIYLVTGPNGVGKTTLINILLGIHQDLRDGRVEYNGVNVADIDLYSTRKDAVSVLLQRVDMPDATVGEYLENSLDLDKSEIASTIRLLNIEEIYLSKNFHIDQYWNSKLNVLSGGEKQKAVLLKVLAKGSNVLILDEPSTGLDDISIKRLLACLLTLKAGRVIILTSHDSRFEGVADEGVRHEVWREAL